MSITNLHGTKMAILLLLLGLSLFSGLHFLRIQISQHFGAVAGIGTFGLLLPAMLALVYWLNRTLHDLGPNEIGLGNKGLWGVLPGLVLGFALVGASLMILRLLEPGRLTTIGIPQNILVLLSFWVMVTSVWEEALFRALVFLALLIHTHRPLFSVLMSSVLFAIPHMIFDHTVSIWVFAVFSLGVLFAYLYFRTGNCWIAVGTHAGFNFASETLDQGFVVFGWASLQNTKIPSHQLQWILMLILVTICLIIMALLYWNPTAKGNLLSRIEKNH